MRSGNETAVRAAVAMPSGQALSPAAAAQLAALGSITFDMARFHRVDALDGTVTGHVQHPPSGQPASWTFTLSYVDGAWRIANAEPVR